MVYMYNHDYMYILKNSTHVNLDNEHNETRMYLESCIYMYMYLQLHVLVCKMRNFKILTILLIL